MAQPAAGGSRTKRSAESPPPLTDAELIRAMRREELFAFIEFIDRFRHLAWNEARCLGIDSSVRKSWTEEVLHDCAIALARDARAMPGNIAGYVVVSVRRRFFAERRTERGVTRLLGEYVNELGDTQQFSSGDLPLPVVELAKALASGITEEEEALLEWKRRKLGYTQVAEWLGVKRDTAAHRTLRLTARLRKQAQKYLESLGEEDVLIVRRFIDGVRRGDK